MPQFRGAQWQEPAEEGWQGGMLRYSAAVGKAGMGEREGRENIQKACYEGLLLNLTRCFACLSVHACPACTNQHAGMLWGHKQHGLEVGLEGNGVGQKCVHHAQAEALGSMCGVERDWKI